MIIMKRIPNWIWNIYFIMSNPSLLPTSRQSKLHKKYLKLLANSIAPYLFKWKRLSFKCFEGSIVSVWLIILMFCCWHIFIKRLFTSLTLLFKWSFRGTISKTWMIFVSFFREFARSKIDYEIWLAVFSVFRSLVPTWRIICSGFNSLIVGFAWSYMHLVLAEPNSLTLTKNLCLMFLVR